MRVLVTGGAGFIGSSFILHGLSEVVSCERLVNLDLLTYASNLNHLRSVEKDPRYFFVKGDIRDEVLVKRLCQEHEVTHLIHFAAESHVDRSIENPRNFLSTNVEGTMVLLEVVRQFPDVHFHHVSTDEVYGSLGENGSFCETSPYRPNSPYSASKAASDHFVRAYHQTYGLRTTLSHCSNNYGPRQHSEKLIPRIIAQCLDKKPLPVYGNGRNIRDWLFVEDHVRALWLILNKGKIGEIYDIGGNCEKRNVDLILELIDHVCYYTGENAEILRSLIAFVPDRLGHDYRYSIDCSKIQEELAWQPKYSFEEGLRLTVKWYLHENRLCHTR